MTDVDAGGGDRLALAVLVQYRMATAEQMHRGDRPPRCVSSRPGTVRRSYEMKG
ncbi:hypothetical protein QF037_006632 [Streptomyces canus]|uniref:hypothetical protein n=1 Tax=Streptomyces canus TaxID=58343 RepID=UPI002783535B|nr:hypothetical protein [Streptomyces canus]MDQ0602287.1 hypothetical protein [Streptomyces canus]